MKIKKNWLILALLLIAASLSAPLLGRLLHFIIIEPIAYYWWGVKRGLAAIPQIWYWFFLVISLSIIVVFFILKAVIVSRKEVESPRNIVGPVQSLAESLTLTERSHYFRWLIANKLARLTLDLNKPPQALENNKKKYMPRDLSSMDWDPPEDIKEYFHAGLNSSLINIRRSRFFRVKKSGNPRLDIELNKVIHYIETMTE